MVRLMFSLFAGLLLIAAILYAGSLVSGRHYGFNSPGSTYEWLRVALISSGTLIGLTSQVLMAQIKAIRANKILIIDELQKFVQSKAFWLAAIASPLVIIAAYKAMSEVNGYLMVFIISYQNGFFWNSVISTREKV
jgi:hypothetical protein